MLDKLTVQTDFKNQELKIIIFHKNTNFPIMKVFKCLKSNTPMKVNEILKLLNLRTYSENALGPHKSNE